jgi:hypothetical protein
MEKTLGPSWPSEYVASGLLGAPLIVHTDGTVIYGETATPEQRATVEALIAAHDPTKPAPPVVPEEVTRYQREVVMRRYGIFAAADAIFMLLPEDDERRIAWLTAPTTKRHSAATLYALQQMNIPDAQADQMFIEGALVE